VTPHTTNGPLSAPSSGRQSLGGGGRQSLGGGQYKRKLEMTPVSKSSRPSLKPKARAVMYPPSGVKKKPAVGGGNRTSSSSVTPSRPTGDPHATPVAFASASRFVSPHVTEDAFSPASTSKPDSSSSSPRADSSSPAQVSLSQGRIPYISYNALLSSEVRKQKQMNPALRDLCAEIARLEAENKDMEEKGFDEYQRTDADLAKLDKSSSEFLEKAQQAIYDMVEVVKLRGTSEGVSMGRLISDLNLNPEALNFDEENDCFLEE
jgi:hypothetical protein